MCGTKLLLTAFLILNGFMLSWQNPLSTNYSSLVLRYAKASQLKAYMDDENAVPCDNFYNFACGKWPHLQPATVKKQKTYYLQQLQDLFERKSVNMLQENNTNDNSVDILLKSFYTSCLKRESLRENSLEPIFKLTNFTGGWPKVHFKQWYEASYDWLVTIAQLRSKLGVNILIGLEFIPDFTNTDNQRIKIGAPQLDLYGKNEEGIEEYQAYVAKRLHIYLPKVSYEWSEQVAAQVVHIEKQLLKGFSTNPALTLQQTTRPTNLNHLREAYGSYVNIARYFQIVFNETIYFDVYEWPEDYFSNLVEVIKNTPKLHLANYTMWRVLQHFEAETHVPNRYDDYWCVFKVLDYFPKQLESMFNRNYKNMHMINELQSVWADIKRGFREQLQSSAKLEWITHETRQKAIQKLENLNLEILSLDENAFYQEMQPLVIKRDYYYDNLINAMQWKTQQELSRLFIKPQKTEESIQLPKYQLTQNKIQIPITALQAHFFWDPEYPSALKYSTLGFLLAHEMIHAFDTEGRKYDKYGSERGWWDSDSEYGFDEKTRCFNEQFKSQKFQGKDVPNNTQTLLTSIRDSGGLAIAHRVYKKWWDNISEQQEKTKEKLPILNFDNNQLFFIGFAQLMCADYHASSLYSIDKLPEALRVNNALSNNIGFSLAFKCAENSAMNPNRKCKIF